MVNLGAADEESAPIPASRNKAGSSGPSRNFTVRKLYTNNNRAILLRTSAVKVVNPESGISTLAYAQHDTGSQVTLISENVKRELGLKTTPDPTVTIRTLADQKVDSEGRTNFKLQLLHNGDEFMIEDALVVPQFSDDTTALPHAVDTGVLLHFHGVDIPEAPDRERVDVLIGQSDKSLLTVLEEREGAHPEEPNYFLTRLGPVASGGIIPVELGSFSSFRVSVEALPSAACDCNELKQKVVALKEAVREYELEDETIQPSKTDELAKSLVEPHIKVVDGRYEMPVPINNEVLQMLPDNYNSALKRTLSLRRNVLRNPTLKKMLLNTFAELVAEEWIVPAGLSDCDTQWYLPFFVTQSAKPRVVYDGAAAADGVSLNQAVSAEKNLLNRLVEVLIRFRLGKYACVADVSKSFFQVRIPRDQQDLFRIVWFENNDIEKGVAKVFRFTRHVWGVTSNPSVALVALNHLVTENPTNACQVTLDAVKRNRYMDDVLLASNKLVDLETFCWRRVQLIRKSWF